MELTFINFWHLYAPRKEFSNRYRACERLWQAMDEKRRALIMRELENEQTGYLLRQGIALQSQPAVRVHLGHHQQKAPVRRTRGNNRSHQARHYLQTNHIPSQQELRAFSGGS